MTPSPEKKRKRDEYELPPMHEDVLSTRTGNERDLRMAHPEDLRQLVDLATRYPDTFGSNLGDIDIDIDSAEFQALSAEDQHDIIVALKVRSRQTSHDRLQRMLGSSGNPLDFSKQQIELLVKRNTLTQQWLQVTGNAHRATGAAVDGGGKVARGRVIGERSREYVLIKGDDPAGGWTLKMGGGGQSGGPEPGDRRNPIAVVDSSSSTSIDGGSDESDDDLFEDVSPARIGGQLALRTTSPYADARSGAGRDIRQGAFEHELVSDDQPLLQLKHQQHYQLQQSIIAKHSHVAGVQAPGRFGPEPVDLDAVSSDESGSFIYTNTNSDIHEVGSSSPSPSSEYNSNQDHDHDHDHGTYMQEAEQHAQEAAMRDGEHKQQRLIMELTAAEFLDKWSRLVTPEMHGFDPSIYERMRYWFHDEALESLGNVVWSTNRQLEKQPEIDNEWMAEMAMGGRPCAVFRDRGGLEFVRARVACLSLLSGFLECALQWRRMRGGEYRSVDECDGRRVGMRELGDAANGVNGVARESIFDQAEEAGGGGGGGGGLGMGLLMSSSMLLPPQPQPPPQPATGFGDAALGEEFSEPREPEEDVAKAHRETIFRKAQLLAEHAGTGARPGIQATSSSSSTHGSQDANKVRHIDSDADYISDDDERSDISDDFINIEAPHGKSAADDANPEADIPENNDGEDEDSGDDDRDAGLDVGEAEQNEYALFIEKLRKPANGSTNRGASYEAMRSELEGEMQSLRARVRNSTRDASGIGADM
ncbi:DNA repair protein rad2, partial [Kickxella alabastrina]